MSRVASFRVPIVVQDVALALFIAVAQVQGVDVRGAGPSEHPITDYANLGVVLLAVPGLALAARRRWPLAVFVVTVASSVVYYAVGFSDGPGSLALWVALYTVTAYGDGRRSLVFAGVGIAVLAGAWLVTAQDIEPAAAIGWVFFRIGASVMSAALGESVRARRVIAADAIARADLAERTRDEEAQARVDAERVRIAREVHDTVAHAIAVINVQAGVTAHVLDKRPEHARETLEGIERTSSHALDEMRTILAMLRDTDDSRDPQPNSAQITGLIAKARDAGLTVEFEANQPRQPLPGAVDRAVYRIVQESITNVIKHAESTHVTVALDYDDTTVEVRISDDGGGPANPPPAAEPGRGIIGMRERCHLLGGELTTGPRPHGGFDVTARLPLAPTGTPA